MGGGLGTGVLARPCSFRAHSSSAVPRVVKFTSQLSAAVAEEGSEATFQCVVSPEDAAVTWYHNGTALQPGEKVVISRSGAVHSLTISGLTLGDAGQISAEAEGISTAASLRVRGEPAWFLVLSVEATCGQQVAVVNCNPGGVSGGGK